MSDPKQPQHRNFVCFCKSDDMSQSFEELGQSSVEQLVDKLKSYLRRYHNYGLNWRMVLGGTAYRSAYVKIPKEFVGPTVKFLTRKGFKCRTIIR